MLHEVAGDILLSRARAIAHGVSPHDSFQEGLALSLRARWPSLYRDFQDYCRVADPVPGGVWAWRGADGTRIFSLFTQEPPLAGGRPGRASLQYVARALRELRRQLEAEQPESLALPRLATGIGGLDWNLVEPLLRQHLGALGIPVIIYATYRNGEAAQEQI